MSPAKSRKNDRSVQKPKRRKPVGSTGTDSLTQSAPKRQLFKDKYPVLYARRIALEVRKKAEKKAEVRIAKRSQMTMEGTKDHPIDVSDNFIIKVEEEEVRVKCEATGTAVDPIQIDMEAARLENCIPALKDPGKRRGFASMTRAERAQHDFREYEGACERREYEPKKVENAMPPAVVISIEDSASDLSDHSNNGHWTEGDGDWIEDDVEYMEEDVNYAEDDVDGVECAAESVMREDSSRTLSLGPPTAPKPAPVPNTHFNSSTGRTLRPRRRTSRRVPFQRLELFRTALGRLMLSGVLTVEEPIEVEALVDAVNTVVAYDYSDEDAETILEQLAKSKELTLNSKEVYLSGSFLQ